MASKTRVAEHGDKQPNTWREQTWFTVLFVSSCLALFLITAKCLYSRAPEALNSLTSAEPVSYTDAITELTILMAFAAVSIFSGTLGMLYITLEKDEQRMSKAIAQAIAAATLIIALIGPTTFSATIDRYIEINQERRLLAGIIGASAREVRIRDLELWSWLQKTSGRNKWQAECTGPVQTQRPFPKIDYITPKFNDASIVLPVPTEIADLAVKIDFNSRDLNRELNTLRNGTFIWHPKKLDHLLKDRDRLIREYEMASELYVEKQVRADRPNASNTKIESLKNFTRFQTIDEVQIFDGRNITVNKIFPCATN